MSNLVPLQNAIDSSESNFNELAAVHGAVNFKAEASFALQILKQNDFLAKQAIQNPDSLKDAVVNVAAIGLTLNPAHKYAYLVPRKKKLPDGRYIGNVCLDISYMGLIQLACDSGAVKWVQAEIVRESDDFSFNGVGLRPTHKMDPLKKDRGQITGAYVVAKTEDGEFLTTVMAIEDIYSIRDRSESWKRNQSGPWKTDEGEMIKKTVIKRAYKTWPKNDKLARLSDAIDVLNNDDPVDFSKDGAIEMATKAQIASIKAELLRLDKDEKGFLEYFSRVVKRDLAGIDDLNMKEAEQAITQLRNFKSPEANDENTSATA